MTSLEDLAARVEGLEGAESFREALIDSGYIRAMQHASSLTQEMCGVIGAWPGSSIHAALSACWEKMDEIVRARSTLASNTIGEDIEND